MMKKDINNNVKLIIGAHGNIFLPIYIYFDDDDVKWKRAPKIFAINYIEYNN